jgi:hypothetical protein
MSLQEINTMSNEVSEKLQLEQLSLAIGESAGIASGYLVISHLPQPSFEADGPRVCEC